MTRHSADYGAKALRRLADALDDPEKLESEYASFLVEKARSLAAARPTPQSGMVADALVVTGNLIRSAGIPMDAVAASSEFGSDLYPQFQHTHTAEGLWLHPAAEDADVLAKTDEALDQFVQETVD
jgi:hypothetical protein